MELFALFIYASLLIEATTEVFIALFYERENRKKYFTALVVGLVVAFTVNLDVFAISPIAIEPRIPYVGNLLAGVLFSRGSNWTHDFLSKLNQPKIEIEPYDPTQGGEEE